MSARPVTILAADIRPLAIRDGPRRGAVLDLVTAAAARAGIAAAVEFLPFPAIAGRARAVPGLLVAPIARTPEREADFTWVARVLDVPQAMGTLSGRAKADLDAARGLRAVAVPRGGVQEAFLRGEGFANLLPVEEARHAAEALADGRADAWYASATQILAEFEAMGRAGEVRLGPAIQAAPVWLAASPDPGALPLAALRDAMAALHREGAVARAWTAYVAAT